MALELSVRAAATIGGPNPSTDVFTSAPAWTAASIAATSLSMAATTSVKSGRFMQTTSLFSFTTSFRAPRPHPVNTKTTSVKANKATLPQPIILPFNQSSEVVAFRFVSDSLNGNRQKDIPDMTLYYEPPTPIEEGHPTSEFRWRGRRHPDPHRTKLVEKHAIPRSP